MIILKFLWVDSNLEYYEFHQPVNILIRFPNSQPKHSKLIYFYRIVNKYNTTGYLLQPWGFENPIPTIILPWLRYGENPVTTKPLDLGNWEILDRRYHLPSNWFGDISFRICVIHPPTRRIMKEFVTLD